jgi:hypothetical protein
MTSVFESGSMSLNCLSVMQSTVSLALLRPGRGTDRVGRDSVVN